MSLKFSILVPVYNVENFIDECIQSVLNQTYSNWELILVDDGSPDNSGAICDRYKEQDDRIKVIHKENQGLISARRVGIANATGDYYCFLDSDDYIVPDMLEVLRKKIADYLPDCIMYGFDRFCIPNGLFSLASKDTMIIEKRSIYKKCFISLSYNAIWGKCVKSSVFDGRDYSAYYKYLHGEDLLQSVEIYQNSHSILVIPDCLYKYRTNPDSITQAENYDNYKHDSTIREYVLNFLENENVLTVFDMKEYVGFALRIIKGEVETIIHFETSSQNKKQLLKKLNNDPYFKRLLKYHCGIKNLDVKTFVVVSLLRMRMYRTLCILGKI